MPTLSPSRNVKGLSAFPDPSNIDVAVDGNSLFSMNNGPCAQMVRQHDDAWNYPTTAAPGPIITSPFMPMSPAYSGSISQDLNDTTAGWLSLPPTTPALSTTASTTLGAEVRYACNFPGCAVSCARSADLVRHTQKHAAGPKRHDCPTPGCSRKGLNGFDRSDKMRNHLKACGRHAGRQ